MARRGRFLFVSWDGGGNVPPALALGHKLVTAGHQVAFLAPPSLQATVEAVGLPFRPYREMADWGSHLHRPIDGEYLGELWLGPAVGGDVAACLADQRPDVLAVDFSLSGAMAAAEQSGLPTAAIAHTLYHLNVEGGARYAVMWEEWLPEINRTRAHFGLAPLTPGGHTWDSAAAVLALTPAEFDRPVRHLPPNVHYVGPVFIEDSALPSKATGPRVLVSFSTTYMEQEELLQRVLDAMAELPVRGLVTTGPSLDSGDLHPPANVTVTGYVDHQEVLPSASAVVTHAGLSTVMAALAHGVPLLCLPQGRDQDANAERVVACGAGLTLGEDASSDQIRASLLEVLESPRLRRGAREMQAIIQRHGNGARAVHILEGLLPPEIEGSGGGS